MCVHMVPAGTIFPADGFPDWPECTCGNVVDAEGFMACDADGNVYRMGQEPKDWDGTEMCRLCGAIGRLIRDASGAIVSVEMITPTL